MAQNSQVLRKSHGSLCRDIFSPRCCLPVLEILLQLIDQHDSSLPAVSPELCSSAPIHQPTIASWTVFPLAAPPPSVRRRDNHDTVPECNYTSEAIVGIWSNFINKTWHLHWDTLQTLKDVWICLIKWRHLLKSWTLLCFTERPNCWNWF